MDVKDYQCQTLSIMITQCFFPSILWKEIKRKIFLLLLFHVFLYIQVRASMRWLNTVESFKVLWMQLCQVVITALEEKYVRMRQKQLYKNKKVILYVSKLGTTSEAFYNVPKMLRPVSACWGQRYTCDRFSLISDDFNAMPVIYLS